MGKRFYSVVFKNRLSYGLLFLLVRFFEIFVKPLSLKSKFSLGRLGGIFWNQVDFPNGEVSRVELALAFGNTRSASNKQRIREQSVSRSFAYLVETYFTSSLSNEELVGLVKNRDWSLPLRKALQEGNGAIVLTAHFGNESLLCYQVGAVGHASCVARNLLAFENLTVAHRKQRNVDTLNEFETNYDLFLNLLAKNEIIISTIDRPLKRVKSVFVDFFGLEMIAPYYPVDIARLSGAPIFLGLLLKIRGKYEMILEGPICVPKDMDERESREKYTQQIFSILEKHIRKYPGEWQWFNKRLAKFYWGVPRYEKESKK